MVIAFSQSLRLGNYNPDQQASHTWHCNILQKTRGKTVSTVATVSVCAPRVAIIGGVVQETIRKASAHHQHAACYIFFNEITKQVILLYVYS